MDNFFSPRMSAAHSRLCMVKGYHTMPPDLRSPLFASKLLACSVMPLDCRRCTTFWKTRLENITSAAPVPSPLLLHHHLCLPRRTLICAINEDTESGTESDLKNPAEIDRLIEMLRNADGRKLQKLVAENILAFDDGFWLRLADKTDNCISEDDKRDYEELSASVMSIVDRLVRQTNEKIESSTDVLKNILKPVVKEGEEILWPPKDPLDFKLMEKELVQREKEGQLDDGFLSEVGAQMRQAKEANDKPGLVAMLQKVLQLYASRVLSRHSYARKGDKILKPEQFLEAIIKAPEEEWNNILADELTIGRGEISPDELYAVIKKRVERVLMRTDGGSYKQRVLAEYLKGIQRKAEETVRAFQPQQ